MEQPKCMMSFCLTEVTHAVHAVRAQPTYMPAGFSDDHSYDVVGYSCEVHTGGCWNFARSEGMEGIRQGRLIGFRLVRMLGVDQ